MMYKRHYIRALAQSARVPATQYMRLDTINETDNRTDHAEMRAILLARAFSHLVHRMLVTASVSTFFTTRLNSRESKSIIQLSISGAHRGTRCLAAGI